MANFGTTAGSLYDDEAQNVTQQVQQTPTLFNSDSVLASIRGAYPTLSTSQAAYDGRQYMKNPAFSTQWQQSQQTGLQAKAQANAAKAQQQAAASSPSAQQAQPTTTVTPTPAATNPVQQAQQQAQQASDRVTTQVQPQPAPAYNTGFVPQAQGGSPVPAPQAPQPPKLLTDAERTKLMTQSVSSNYNQRAAAQKALEADNQLRAQIGVGGQIGPMYIGPQQSPAPVQQNPAWQYAGYGFDPYGMFGGGGPFGGGLFGGLPMPQQPALDWGSLFQAGLFGRQPAPRPQVLPPQNLQFALQDLFSSFLGGGDQMSAAVMPPGYQEPYAPDKPVNTGIVPPGTPNSAVPAPASTPAPTVETKPAVQPTGEQKANNQTAKPVNSTGATKAEANAYGWITPQTLDEQKANKAAQDSANKAIQAGKLTQALDFMKTAPSLLSGLSMSDPSWGETMQKMVDAQNTVEAMSKGLVLGTQQWIDFTRQNAERVRKSITDDFMKGYK
ncbi:hypothetical protein [Azospirillum sp. sgz301742]